MVFTKATQRFLKKTKQTPRQIPPPQRFIPQPQRPWNQFAKDQDNPTPIESSFDLLFGGEGEREVSRQQAIFPELQMGDAGDLISSVQQEMFGSQEPQQQMPMRRRMVRRRK